MPEVRRQKRGEQRRVQVLEAALRILARVGPRGVTHRAVATEAGTSLRATTYYFDSREQLLIEALQHYAATAIERFEALVPDPEVLRGATPNVRDAAADLLAQTVISDLTADRDGLIAEYELVLEASRNPTLETTYREWQERLEGMLRGYSQLLGSDDPDLDARIALATLRGLEIEALARPSQLPDRADLARVFRRLLDGMDLAASSNR